MLSPLPFAEQRRRAARAVGVWLLVTDLLLGAAAVAVFPLLIVLNVDVPAARRPLLQHRAGRARQAQRRRARELRRRQRREVVRRRAARDRAARRHRLAPARGPASRRVRLRSTFEALLDGIPNVVNILLLVGGAYRVRSGEMTVGELTSFIYLFTLLVFPLRLIGFALSELPHSQAGWNRIQQLLEEPVEADPARPLRRGTTQRRRCSPTCGAPTTASATCCAASTRARRRPGAPSRSSAPPAPARRRCCTSSPG